MQGRPSMLPVVLFAGLDGDCKYVLFRRQRTGGKRGEGAGWIGGFVEVDLDFIPLRQRRIEETARTVGGPGAGCVLEHEEEFAVLKHWFEPHCSALKREFGEARGRLPIGHPENVRDRDGPGFRVCHPFGLDEPGRAGREPFAAREIAAGFGVRIAQTDAELASALDDGQADVAELEDVGMIGGVGFQLAFFINHLAVVQAQCDRFLVGYVDCILSLLQPLQASYGQPAVRSFERRFVARSPLRIAGSQAGGKDRRRYEYEEETHVTSVWRSRSGPCRRSREV